VKTVLLLRRALRALEDDLVKDSLGASERLLLVRLLDGDALPSELASDLVLSRGRLSHIVSLLEKKGYITLAPLERDRRSKKVSLTPDGRPLALRAKANLQRIETALDNDLGSAELMLLRQMLRTISK